jgi:hypothetical protein
VGRGLAGTKQLFNQVSISVLRNQIERPLLVMTGLIVAVTTSAGSSKKALNTK